MLPVLEKRPTCIVLDEFQWMANYRREMVSDLKLVWEQYLAKVPGVKLILCGSIASFMATKVVRSSALYGRTDLEIHLKEFLLGEARQLLPDKGLDEVVEAYLYFGGVPKYLELVRDYPSVRRAVEELAFRENGYFVEEYERIFTSHFGRNPDFRKIVAALAACPQGLFRQELADQAGVAAGGLLTEHLADLEAAGFVSSVVPLDKDPNLAADQVLPERPVPAFLLRLHPAQPAEDPLGHAARDVRSAGADGRFHAWRGKAFEHLCIAHARRMAEILGFAGIDFACGPYFRLPFEK